MQKFLKYCVLICRVLPIMVSIGINAQRYAVSGYIVDQKTKETLIGATVFEASSGIGVVSDIYGYFQFAGLSKGSHTLTVSYLGYEPFELKVEIVNKSLILPEIRLEQKLMDVEEATIIAARPDVAADRQVETSMIELSAKTIQSIPTAGNDVFSAIKFMPGIDRTEPFSPLYTARGGEPGENAVLLDGIMIYNPYHSSISSGIFNTQIMKSVDLLVGGFGAEYGGRNSSVMYITTRDGNSSELHGEIEPSTFHSKIFLEFPVGGRGSAMVAGRYFYDIFSEFIFQSRSYFYDFNLSYTYRLNDRNRLSFKYFQSRDRNIVDFNSFYKILGNTIGLDIYDNFNFQLINRWTNRAATLIHKWVINPRIYVRSQLYYSSHESNNLSSVDFRFDAPTEQGDTAYLQLTTSSDFVNHLSDICGKTFINFMVFRGNNIRIGAETNSYNFENGAQINGVDQGKLARYPVSYSLFMEDRLEAGPVIFRPGIRLNNNGFGNWFWEPRVNAVVSLPAGFRIKGAWGRYSQFIISMNTNEVEMNQAVDYYFPLNRYSPSTSVHYILGLEKQLNPQSILSLDLYYKDIQKVYTFDINQASDEVLALSDKLLPGRGEAYGLELMLRGGVGNLSGWASYGLAWATRQYPGLYDGRSYPYDYNRRHTLKVVANVAISSNLEYNASFIYMSGIPRSIEQTMQTYYYYEPVSGQISSFPIWIPAGKNTARMPSVINLDMSVRKKLREGFGKYAADKFGASESYVTVTIRNLTFFRRNVEYFYPIAGVDRWNGKYLPIGMNLFPMVGLSYTIKF